MTELEEARAVLAARYEKDWDVLTAKYDGLKQAIIDALPEIKALDAQLEFERGKLDAWYGSEWKAIEAEIKKDYACQQTCHWCGKQFQATSHNLVHFGGHGDVYGCDQCLGLKQLGEEALPQDEDLLKALKGHTTGIQPWTPTGPSGVQAEG